MQRTLVILTIFILVVASVAVGALASNWPFWSRALAWHQAGDGWPETIRGPWHTLQPSPSVAPLELVTDAGLDPLARELDTQVLLVAEGNKVRAHFAPGYSLESPVDGRGLAEVLPTLLVGVLVGEGRPGLLDLPVGSLIDEWREDPRGSITPRQLLWQLSGLPAGPFRPFNPFSEQSQLRAGPDFRRAALGIGTAYPPGSHFEAAPVNAQLLAAVAEAVTREPYAAGLQTRLWGRLAAHPAQGLLDRRRGSLSGHCCFIAAAGDWLRLAQLVAGAPAGSTGPQLAPEFVAGMPVSSPVHPGQGLGFEVEQAAEVAGAGREGSATLVLSSQGRMLAANPATGRALFWAGRSLTLDARRRLLEELAPGTSGPRQ
jgi:hypothetical protein